MNLLNWEDRNTKVSRFTPDPETLDAPGVPGGSKLFIINLRVTLTMRIFALRKSDTHNTCLVGHLKRDSLSSQDEKIKDIVRDRAGVARWAHNPKVVGSNPSPATNRTASVKLAVFLFGCERQACLKASKQIKKLRRAIARRVLLNTPPLHQRATSGAS